MVASELFLEGSAHGWSKYLKLLQRSERSLRWVNEETTLVFLLIVLSTTSSAWSWAINEKLLTETRYEIYDPAKALLHEANPSLTFHYTTLFKNNQLCC